MKKKHSQWLLASGAIATLYVLYLAFYYGDLVLTSEGIARETALTLTAFVAPHFLFTAIAVVLNWFAFAMDMRPLALGAGVLYIIGCLAGILYIPMNLIVLVSAVLSFIGFAKLKGVIKIDKLNLNEEFK